MKRYIKSSKEKTRYTQKELKQMAEDGEAIDITTDPNPKLGKLETLGTSQGTYGTNGALLRDYDTGQLYVITKRNSNLMKIRW